MTGTLVLIDMAMISQPSLSPTFSTRLSRVPRSLVDWGDSVGWGFRHSYADRDRVGGSRVAST